MKESFRWYGTKDIVSLNNILQAGATHLVSALHNISNGEVWDQNQINSHKEIIRKSGLKWEVVESVPIHEDIKLRKGSFQSYIKNYIKTLENLASCGIKTVCYNFMPVLDWTRTDLNYMMKDGSKALYFNLTALVAFDLFILNRDGSDKLYNEQQLINAKKYFENLSSEEVNILTNNIIKGLPGSEEGYNLEKFKKQLEKYNSISKDELRNNLLLFLKEIIPVAEKHGLKMCIHPDDPPFPLFGIPRVVSTFKDLNFIFSSIPSISNGLTFCTGSLGVRKDNDLKFIFNQFADRIHFLHLRSTQRDEEGNFFEANHLEGDVDMYTIVKSILNEEKKRKKSGISDYHIPMRPDHGHQMLDDLLKNTNPGYSAIGRLRGLAELRGLALGISESLNK